MSSYGEYLQSLSLITPAEAIKVNSYATQAQQALSSGNPGQATNLWGQQQQYVSSICGNCNWYDVINSTDTDKQEAILNQILSPDGSVYKEKLSKIVPPGVVFGANSGLVFDTLSNAFMVDSIAAVDYLLANQVKVNILSGQLDLIVDVLCAEAWMAELKWPGLSEFLNKDETVIEIGGIPQAMVTNYQNLWLWKVFRAGHMVCHDNGPMALLLLQMLLQE